MRPLVSSDTSVSKEQPKYSFDTSIIWEHFSLFMPCFYIVPPFLLGTIYCCTSVFSCQFCDVAKVVNMCVLLFQLKMGKCIWKFTQFDKQKEWAFQGSQVTSQPDLYRLWILQQLKFELTTERNAWDWLCMPQSFISTARFTVDKVVHEHWGYPQISSWMESGVCCSRLWNVPKWQLILPTLQVPILLSSFFCNLDGGT
jgi:hypothetical protein